MLCWQPTVAVSFGYHFQARGSPGDDCIIRVSLRSRLFPITIAQPRVYERLPWLSSADFALLVSQTQPREGFACEALDHLALPPKADISKLNRNCLSLDLHSLILVLAHLLAAYLGSKLAGRLWL